MENLSDPMLPSVFSPGVQTVFIEDCLCLLTILIFLVVNVGNLFIIWFRCLLELLELILAILFHQPFIVYEYHNSRWGFDEQLTFLSLFLGTPRGEPEVVVVL